MLESDWLSNLYTISLCISTLSKSKEETLFTCSSKIQCTVTNSNIPVCTCSYIFLCIQYMFLTILCMASLY